MRKKIAVVGDKGSVLGFKSVGFEVFPKRVFEIVVRVGKKKNTLVECC